MQEKAEADSDVILDRRRILGNLRSYKVHITFFLAFVLPPTDLGFCMAIS